MTIQTDANAAYPDGGAVSKAGVRALWEKVQGVANSAVHAVTAVGGTGDLITGTVSADYVDATSSFIVQVPTTNATVSPMLQLNGGTQRSIVRADGTPIAIGDLTAGSFITLRRNGAQFFLLSSVKSDWVKAAISAAGETTVITNATSAAARDLNYYKSATANLNINPNGEGGFVSNLPSSVASPAVNAHAWNEQRGALVAQNLYVSGDQFFSRTYNPVGAVWSAWASVTGIIPITVATLSAGNRIFSGAMLSAVGVQAVLDGSQFVADGPFGNQAYSGLLFVDKFNGKERQRLFLTGYGDSPFFRYGATGDWKRLVSGASDDVVLFVGDSITFGIGASDADVFGWAYVAGDRLGCAYSVHGTVGAQMEIAGLTQQYQIDGSFNPWLLANVAKVQAANYLVLAFGINDWNKDVPIGTIADTAEGTFYGALRKGWEYMNTNAPNCKLILCTPIYYATSGTNPAENITANSAGHVVEDYRVALRAFAKEFALPVVEGRDGCGINRVNVFANAPDGAHPNDKGHGMVGRHNAAQIAAQM